MFLNGKTEQILLTDFGLQTIGVLFLKSKQKPHILKPYILLFVLCFSLSVVQAQKIDNKAYNKVMDSIAANNPLPTFIVGGLTKNGLFYKYHHGNKLWEGKEPITANHIFRIYSIL